ncbi:MAG: LacI family transcriptional regulator [Chloroflexi bacterium]|nr:MAG: LacI family transcriptional regulator [Chloroflexota bacterium]
MRIEDLSVQEIAKCVERDVHEVEKVWNAWLAGRQGSSKPIVPDIRLLAGLSGLSTTSVSNFLRNKKGSISEKNSKRLAELVEMVGYVPSSAAQSMRGGQLHTIAVALPLSSVSPDFYLQILKGIKKEASILGYQLLIFDVNTVAGRTDFFSNMPFLGIVDGLIAIGLHIDERTLRILNQRNVPVTAVHNRLEHPPVVANIISPDESAFQNLIDQHLIKTHGYRRLTLVSLDEANPLKMGDSSRDDWNRKARVDAYKEALRLNNIQLDENLIFRVTEHSFKEGYNAFERIYQVHQSLPPDEQIQAIVCTSDTLAAGVITAARREDWQIPVTGFDNLPLAELLDITTVEQRPQEAGRLAFRHLYNALIYQQRTGEFPAQVENGIDMQVVLRCSCGCPH